MNKLKEQLFKNANGAKKQLISFAVIASVIAFTNPAFCESEETRLSVSETVQQPSIQATEKEGDHTYISPVSSAAQPVQDGVPCVRWAASDLTPRAAILCVHGLGLHNGSFKEFGKRMSSLGYVVYAVDMRGFGSFKESRGKEQVDFDGCLADIKAALKVLHRAHPGLPVFLLGESMGGAIVMHATASFPGLIDGTVSVVPSGTRFNQGKSSISVAMHALEGGLNKQFDVGSGVIKQATEKAELREAWANDPLNRLNLSPRELMIFQNFMDHNHAVAPLIKNTPVLMVQGCKDKLVKPEGTVELFNELTTPDRRIQLVENGEHLIFEEGQASDAALDSLTNWLDLHIISYQNSHLHTSSDGQK